MAGPEKGSENGPRFCKACGPRFQTKLKGRTSLLSLLPAVIMGLLRLRSGPALALRSPPEAQAREPEVYEHQTQAKHRPVMGPKIEDGESKLAKASRPLGVPTLVSSR